MSLTLLIFWILALAGLAGASLVLLRKDAAQAAGAFAGTCVAAAGLMLLMQAPFVALVQAGVGAGVAWAVALAASSTSAPVDGARRPLWTRMVAGGALGVVAYVFASTLARQYVSFGADLAKRPRPLGGADEVFRLLAGRQVTASIALVAAGLVVVLLAVAALRGAAEAKGEGTP